MKEKKKFFDRKIPDLIATIFWAIVFIFLGEVLGAIVLQLCYETGDATIIFAGMYASFIGIWIVTLFYLLITKKNRCMFRLLGKESKGNNWKTSFSIGLISGLGLNLLIAIVAICNGDIVLYFHEFHLGLFLLFVISVAIQSGAEELVDRLFIYQRLRRMFPDIPAIAILGNAVFFAALHLLNPGISVLSIFNIVLVGIFYSLIVYYYDSFWGVVIAHTSWNFCQSILLGLPNSGIVSEYSVFKLDASSARNSFAYNVDFGIEGTILTDILLFIACVVVVMLGRKRNQKALDIWS